MIKLTTIDITLRPGEGSSSITCRASNTSGSIGCGGRWNVTCGWLVGVGSGYKVKRSSTGINTQDYEKLKTAK